MTHSPIGGIGKTVGGIEISVGGIENSIGGIGKTVGGIGKTSLPAVIRSLDDERSTRRLKGLKVSPAGLHVERTKPTGRTTGLNVERTKPTRSTTSNDDYSGKLGWDSDDWSDSEE